MTTTVRPWHAGVLTLFPEMFPGPLGFSLAGRALETGIWQLDCADIRDHARDRHRTVDDTPFGGGAGMVMRADIAESAVLTARSRAPESVRSIYLSPRGRPLDQALVQDLSRESGVILLCGRYEGLDQRAIDSLSLEEISLGDYVLSGGEPAALALLDACVRLLPGVMGNCATPEEESFECNLLEYPHYTRPAIWRDNDGKEWPVPEVLTSGHHGAVAEWRQRQAEEITRARRPDLWAKRRGKD